VLYQDTVCLSLDKAFPHFFLAQYNALLILQDVIKKSLKVYKGITQRRCFYCKHVEQLKSNNKFTCDFSES